VEINLGRRELFLRPRETVYGIRSKTMTFVPMIGAKPMNTLSQRTANRSSVACCCSCDPRMSAARCLFFLSAGVLICLQSPIITMP
jgi:hypothetical protein